MLGYNFSSVYLCVVVLWLLFGYVCSARTFFTPPELILNDGFEERILSNNYNPSFVPQVANRNIHHGPEQLKDQITSDLSRMNADVDNSDRFLLSLYERLVNGSNIQQTAVHSQYQQLHRADTIRSFTPTGKQPELCFNNWCT